MALTQKLIPAIILLIFSCQSYSQNHALTVKNGSFEIDKNLSLIIWHTPNIDSTLVALNKANTIQFHEDYHIIKHNETTQNSSKIKEVKIPLYLTFSYTQLL